MEGMADVFQSVKAARNQRPYMVSTLVSALSAVLNVHSNHHMCNISRCMRNSLVLPMLPITDSFV